MITKKDWEDISTGISIHHSATEVGIYGESKDYDNPDEYPGISSDEYYSISKKIENNPDSISDEDMQIISFSFGQFIQLLQEEQWDDDGNLDQQRCDELCDKIMENTVNYDFS